MTTSEASIDQRQNRGQLIHQRMKEAAAQWCKHAPDSEALQQLQGLVDQVSEWSGTLQLTRLVELSRSIVSQAMNAYPDLPAESVRSLLEAIGPEGRPSGDRMNYLIRVRSAFGEIWSADSITQSLISEGVQGIDTEAIQQLFQKKQFDQWVCVAKGTQPVPGNDATFVDEVGVYGQPGLLEPFGDYSNDPALAMRFCSVDPDTLLIRKKDAQEGQPGEDVFGETVAGPMGIDYDHLPFVGAKVADDGRKLLAGVQGHALVEEGQLVVTAAEGCSTSDLKEGQFIQANSSVCINGVLNAGTQVESPEYVFLPDEVQAATIHAGKSIIAKAAIQASEECSLNAKSNIVVSAMLNVSAKAQGAVYVDGPIADSTVEAKRVWCGGNDAAIRGGKIIAWDDVSADVLGAEPAVKTEIILGEERAGLKNKRRETTIHIDERKTQIKKLSVALAKLPEELIQLHDKAHQLRMSLLNLKKEVKQLTRQLRSITLQLQAGEDASRTVRARTCIYPGVTIRIFGKPFVVDSKLGPSCITWANNEVVCLPYQERSWSDGFGGAQQW